MGIPRVFGFCAAFLFASSVTAANIIDLGPSDYKNWGSSSYHHHPNGINAKFGQTIRMPPMNTNLTVTRNPVIPYGSIVNGAKNFVRINPASIAASAAITALFLGLDWVFDEELDSWMKEGEGVPIPVSDTYISWVDVTSGNDIGRFSTPMEACQHAEVWAGNNFGGWEFETRNIRYGTSTFGYCEGLAVNEHGQTIGTSFVFGNISRRGNGCPPGSMYDTTLRACLMPQGLVPLDNSDWAELESSLPNAPATTVGSAAGDAMQRQGAPLPGFTDTQIEGPASTTGPETTTTTTTETGDNIVTSTTTTTNYNYGDTTITTTNTTTSTTYTNGSQTSTETTTETPGELPITDGGGAPPAGEWPGFCDWATVVCDWLNWTQEEPPPDVDLPKPIDDDFFNEKTISFGAKSCPPDHEIDLAPFLSTSVGVSFQPLCDFAGLIYYMVMAASYIIAAYISIGVARNG